MKPVISEYKDDTGNTGCWCQLAVRPSRPVLFYSFHCTRRKQQSTPRYTHMPCKHSSSSGHTLTVVQGEQVLLLITPPFPGSLTNDFFMSTLLLEPSSTRDDLATTRIIPSLPHTLRSSSSTSASVPFSTGVAFSLTSNAAESYAWPSVSNSTKANKTLSSEWLPGCMLSVVGAQWSAKHIVDGWFSAARELPSLLRQTLLWTKEGKRNAKCLNNGWHIHVGMDGLRTVTRPTY